MSVEELFTITQAASLLKVHPLTVRRYIREGKLPALRIGGNVRLTGASLKTFTRSFVPFQKISDKTEDISPARLFSLSDPLFSLRGKGMKAYGV